MEFDKNGILNRAKAAQQTAAVMDEGLRAYMLKVYNYMATGILLTGICLLYTSPSPRDMRRSRMPSSA